MVVQYPARCLCRPYSIKDKMDKKKRFNDSLSNSKWQTLTWYLLNIEKDEIRNKLPRVQRNKCLMPFHMQLLDCWEEVPSVQPNTIEEIYNKYIFDDNKYIHSGNQPLQYNLLNMPKNVAKDLVIRDIISNQGKILTLPDIEGKFQISLDILAYNTLVESHRHGKKR